MIAMKATKIGSGDGNRLLSRRALRRTRRQSAVAAALVLVGLLVAGAAWGEVIWSATMTVGHADRTGDGDGHYYGWESGLGTLSDTIFDYGNTTYTFFRLYRSTQTTHRVAVGFNPALATNDGFEDLYFVSVKQGSSNRVVRQLSSDAIQKRGTYTRRLFTLSAFPTAEQWENGNTVDLSLVTRPAQPMDVSASVGMTQVTLSWSDPGDASITGWQYRHSTDAGTLGAATWMDIAGSGATTTQHVVTGLTGGTSYWFEVRARNVAGAGTASAVLSAATLSQGLNVRTPPQAPQEVSAAAGEEAAALQVQLIAGGTDVGVASFQVRVEAFGGGTLSDIAMVRAYLDANGDGAPDADELVGQGAIGADGTATIRPAASLTFAQGVEQNLVFTLQFERTLAAAGGGVALLGGLLAFAAGAGRGRQRRGGSRSAGAKVAAALLALVLVLAVAGCQEALPQGPDRAPPTDDGEQPEPEARSYRLTLVSIAVEGGADVAGLPPEGITGATVTIDQ